MQPCNRKNKWEEACHKDVRSRTVPEMPKCGHTLRRDVTANLLSTILSLWFFHYKLGTRFNFSTRDVCLSDHHARTLSLTLTEWVCPLGEGGEDAAFYSKSPNLKKTLSTRSRADFFFSPLLKASVLPLMRKWPANRNTCLPSGQLSNFFFLLLLF